MNYNKLKGVLVLKNMKQLKTREKGKNILYHFEISKKRGKHQKSLTILRLFVHHHDKK